MSIVHDSIRAVTRCQVGPARFGNLLARWAQQRYAAAWRARGARDVVVAHTDRGLRMCVEPTHHIGGAIYWRGCYARRILQCIEPLLRPEMTLVDVGANQGEISLFAARRLLQGRVLAFEPLAENYQRLLTNLRLNDLTNVEAIDCCLGDRQGEVELFLPEAASPCHAQGWNEGLTSIYTSDEATACCGRTRICRLDDLAPTLGIERMDVMKIDVEGAELDVLRGAQESLRQFRPVIVVEINPAALRAAGHEPRELCHWLHDRGYHGYQIGRRGKPAARVLDDVPQHCDSIWMPRS